MKTSWKTTLFGVLTGVGMIVSQALTLLDNDPNTNPQWALVVAGIGAIIHGSVSRDNNVTSEKAGAK